MSTIPRAGSVIVDPPSHITTVFSALSTSAISPATLSHLLDLTQPSNRISLNHYNDIATRASQTRASRCIRSKSGRPTLARGEGPLLHSATGRMHGSRHDRYLAGFRGMEAEAEAMLERMHHATSTLGVSSMPRSRTYILPKKGVRSGR